MFHFHIDFVIQNWFSDSRSLLSRSMQHQINRAQRRWGIWPPWNTSYDMYCTQNSRKSPSLQILYLNWLLHHGLLLLSMFQILKYKTFAWNTVSFLCLNARYIWNGKGCNKLFWLLRCIIPPSYFYNYFHIAPGEISQRGRARLTRPCILLCNRLLVIVNVVMRWYRKMQKQWGHFTTAIVEVHFQGLFLKILTFYHKWKETFQFYLSLLIFINIFSFHSYK